MPNSEVEMAIKELWQSTREEGVHMSLTDIQRRARRFETDVRVRNASMYFVAIGVGLIAAKVCLGTPNVLIQWGTLIAIAGPVYAIYKIHQRGAAQVLPESMGTAATVDFHRTSLIRQRDFYQGFWPWYLSPTHTTVVMLTLASLIRDGILLNPTRTPEQTFFGFVTVGFSFVLISPAFFIGKIFKRAARQFQSEIAELDRASQ